MKDLETQLAILMDPILIEVGKELLTKRRKTMSTPNNLIIHSGRVTFAKSIRNIRTMQYGYVVYIRDIETNELFYKFIWDKEMPNRYVDAAVKSIMSTLVNQEIMFRTKANCSKIWALAVVGEDN